jgi:ribose 1,5-bisphosphokinase PhnN
VAGAYRTTLIKELEKEVLVLLINIYYSELRARHIQRTYFLLAKVFIQEQCKIIKERLKQRRRQRAQPAQVSVTQEKIE